MRYLSLFSGVESASVAWGPLGWWPVAFAEVDPFARAVLAHRFPGVPNLGDVRGIDGDRLAALGPIDLVVYGFPCQDISVAGKQRGFRDEQGTTRSGLFFEAARIVRLAAERCGCRWFVLENPGLPGLLTSSGGSDFAEVLREATGLAVPVPRGGWRNSGVAAVAGWGWSACWRVLDAQYVRVAGFPRAVPQRRRRVYLVGHLGDDWRASVAVLLEPDCLSGDPPPRRKVESDVARALTAPAGGGGYRLLSDGQKTMVPYNIIGTGQTSQRHAYETDVSGCLQHKGLCPTSNQAATVIAFQERGRAEGRRLECQEGVSYALRAVDGGGCGDWFRVATRASVRRLTPLECERLQGFPDGWTLVPYRGKPAWDGLRYKAIGNAMPVNVMRWLGVRIEMVRSGLAGPGRA